MTRIIRQFTKEPSVRVKIAHGKERIVFQCPGPFSIQDQSGNTLFHHIHSSRKWRIKATRFEKPQFFYSLVLRTASLEPEARREVEDLKKRGLEARVEISGGQMILDGKAFFDNSLFHVMSGEYNSREEAERHSRHLAYQMPCRIVRIKIREPRCLLEICDADYEKSAESENFLHLLNDAEGRIRLFGVSMSRKHQKSIPTQSSYKYPVSFGVSSEGSMIAFSSIPLEWYVQGVLFAEMGVKRPFESLKAMAVAARTWALGSIGNLHHEEPFEFCFDDHCQRFSGFSRYAPEIEKAVKETRGWILTRDGRLMDTPSTAVCGGLFEESRNGAPAELGSSGMHWDGDRGAASPIQGEESILHFLLSKPVVHCSPNSQCTRPVPDPSDQVFRWEINQSRHEMEKLISRKLDRDIGMLFDIRVHRRSVSGRVLSIEIIASRLNTMVQGYTDIREVLSSTRLPSPFFLIEKSTDPDGIPGQFSFIGAGWGDGMGMCRAGAIHLASQGWKYTDILRHYFPGAKPEKAYS